MPLDNLWKGIGGQLKGFLNTDDGLVGPLKSSLESGLAGRDTSAIGRGLGMVRSVLVLIANIFVAILEIVLWLLKGALRLIS